MLDKESVDSKVLEYKIKKILIQKLFASLQYRTRESESFGLSTLTTKMSFPYSVITLVICAGMLRHYAENTFSLEYCLEKKFLTTPPPCGALVLKSGIFVMN